MHNSFIAMADLGDDLSDWVDSLLEQTSLVTGSNPVPIDEVETDTTLFWTEGQEAVETGIAEGNDGCGKESAQDVHADQGAAAQGEVLAADVLSCSEGEVEENEDSAGDGEEEGEPRDAVGMGDELEDHAMEEDELGVESGEGEVESIMAGGIAAHTKEGEEKKQQSADDGVEVEGGESLGMEGNADEARPMVETATQVRCILFFRVDVKWCLSNPVCVYVCGVCCGGGGEGGGAED